MRRSSCIYAIANVLYESGTDSEEAVEKAEELLTKLESMGLKPSPYVNPKAYEDEAIEMHKGEHWGYVCFISKYPEHYYTYKNKRPYEYYVEGWQPEDVCNHESDGLIYTSNPPQNRCIKCKEYYR